MIAQIKRIDHVHSNIKFKFLIVMILLMTSIFMQAQDTHYWTYQYGTKSTLLGGAVIGSVLDLSGSFYNPGGLALAEEPDVVMASKVYHYPTYSLKNVKGTDIDLTKSTLSPAPSMVAGLLNFKSKKKFLLIYSFFTRQTVDMNISQTFSDLYDIMPDIPGTESVYARMELEEGLNESWAGLTFARKIRKNIGIGISQYITVRNHNARYSMLAEVLPATGQLALTMDTREYDYQNIRLLWKMGVAVDLKRWTFGLTVTTPSIKILSEGSAGLNGTVSGQDLNNDNEPDDWMAATYQEKLKSNYHTPLSIGFGLTYKFKDTKLYFSSEWFNAVSKFDVLGVNNFEAQTGGEEIPFSITHELDSAINFALGVEHIFSKRFAAYASFTMDHSAKKSGSDTNLTLTNWDILHFMLGAIFSIDRFNFTLGIGYSFGGTKSTVRYRQFQSNRSQELIGLIDTLDFKYSNIKLVFGLSF